MVIISPQVHTTVDTDGSVHVGQAPGLADARYSKDPQMAVLLLLTARLEHATNLLANAFPSHLYGDRLTVGRRAQLGPDMVYRTSIGGNSVDSSLTYGEYDLGHFAALVDRALEDEYFSFDWNCDF